SVMEMALTAGATFVAQSFSTDLKDLTAIIEAGIKHKGFSLINVFSPCVTYNKVNTYDWFKENLTKLANVEGYDTTDRSMAMQTIIKHTSDVTGIIYPCTVDHAFQALVHGFSKILLFHSYFKLHKEMIPNLMEEFMSNKMTLLREIPF